VKTACANALPDSCDSDGGIKDMVHRANSFFHLEIAPAEWTQLDRFFAAPVLFATDEAPKNSPLSAIRESNQRST
jgi:hypothetical protein